MMPAGWNIMQMKGLGSLESNEPSHASGVAGPTLPVTIQQDLVPFPSSTRLPAEESRGPKRPAGDV